MTKIYGHFSPKISEKVFKIYREKSSTQDYVPLQCRRGSCSPDNANLVIPCCCFAEDG